MATKAARKYTRMRVTFMFPRYRRGSADPACAFCTHSIETLHMQASVLWENKWHYMHGHCALQFCELALVGREPKIQTNGHGEVEAEGEVIMSSGPIQVG